MTLSQFSPKNPLTYLHRAICNMISSHDDHMMTDKILLYTHQKEVNKAIVIIIKPKCKSLIQKTNKQEIQDTSRKRKNNLLYLGPG